MTDPILMITAQVLPWAVFLCGLVAAIVIVERAFKLGRKRIPPLLLAARLRTVVRHGEPAELESFCGAKHSPAMDTLRRFAALWRSAPSSRARLYDQASGEELEAMERRLPLLATLAGMTPLLGVLTVVAAHGELFGSTQGGSPSAYGGLFLQITVAASLLTGILALVMYNVFVVRVRAHARDLERLGWELLPHIDGIAGTPGVPDAARPEVAMFDEDEFFRKKV